MVCVFDQRIKAALAVDTAHRDDRELAVVFDEAFENEWAASQGVPRTIHCDIVGEHRLAFAVVAEPARLQDRRQAELADASVQFFLRIHFFEWGGANAELA